MKSTILNGLMILLAIAFGDFISQNYFDNRFLPGLIFTAIFATISTLILELLKKAKRNKK
jgi:predicted outer membrane lipoprotein